MTTDTLDTTERNTRLTCPVCHTAISRAVKGLYKSCFACRKRCNGCGKEISEHQARLYKVCDSPNCRAFYIREVHGAAQDRIELHRHEKQVFRRKVEAFRDDVAESESISEPASYSMLIVPANNRSVTRLPEERKQEFREHLRQLIEAAVEAGTQGSSASLEVALKRYVALPILGVACSTCRGRCCFLGEESKAFITTATLRRFMDANPEMNPDDVLEAYCGFFEEETYENSCIYHHASGCALPRAMRSNTCNDYECDGQRDYLRETIDGCCERSFVAAATPEGVVRYRFVDSADLT